MRYYRAVDILLETHLHISAKYSHGEEAMLVGSVGFALLGAVLPLDVAAVLCRWW